MAYSVKNICQFFWQAEQKHKLFEDTSTQLHWLPFRFRFYYYITETIGLFEKAHPVKNTKAQKMDNFLRSIRAFFCSPFFRSIHQNVLVPSSRKINGADIYSERVIGLHGGNLSIIDSALHGFDQESDLNFDVFNFVVKFIAQILSPAYQLILIKNTNLVSVLDEFVAEFKLDKNKVYKLYAQTYLRFKFSSFFLFVFFKLKSVKRLYIVCAYLRMDYVFAAKRAGVEVIELQHGTITPYHLGYSYPSKPSLIVFPDQLWCFGKFWSESTSMPKGTKFKVIGAPYINRLAAGVKGINNKKFGVVFNSQGVVGTKIFNFALNVAELMPALEVIFRLHPSEELSKYDNLLKESRRQPSNFLLSHKSPNIFELMASYEYVSGVFSTTLFEAMYLGLKIILIDDVGVEYMESSIERGEAIVVKTPSDFVQVFMTSKVADGEYYYSSVTYPMGALDEEIS
jgi:hypothetical protein